MRPGVKGSRAADAASSNACTADTGSDSDPSATRVMISPMSAARHAEVMRKRIAQRRMLEEARELKKAGDSGYGSKR